MAYRDSVAFLYCLVVGPVLGALPADQVHGRDELVDDLVERFTARRVTALMGPRRVGKTSVLSKVADVVSGGGRQSCASTCTRWRHVWTSRSDSTWRSPL